MALFTSLLTSFVQCRAGEEFFIFFPIKDFLELLGDPGFVVVVDGDRFEGIMLSTQKEMYDVTVLTCSSMSSEGQRRLSQSVALKHPCKVRILSTVHCLMFLVTFLVLLMTEV